MRITKLNKTTLINGDCLDKQVIDKIPNDFDIVFTSPPYNLGSKNWGVDNKIWTLKSNKYAGVGLAKEKDNKANYKDWLKEIILTYLDKCEYFFLNIQALAANKIDIIELQYELRYYYCDRIIWNKANGIPHARNSRVMTATFEDILIFSKKNPNNRRVGTKEWKGNVWNLVTMPGTGSKVNKFSDIHKALFPVSLPKHILSNFVKPNGKVLDVFGGLFTTAIAAEELGMESYSIEIEELYYNKGIERIKSLK